MTAQHSESSEDVLAGTLHGRPRAVIRKALLAFARPLLGLRIFGEGNVPTSGALLVVSNHVSNADPPFLELAFPRPLFFMGKSELFRNRPLGWLLRRFGGFPVARGTPDRAALRFAEAVLRQEVAMGIFPEGGRSTSGALGRGYAGVGLLALRSAAPILPVAIYGTEYYPVNGVMPPRRTAGERRQVVIRFGEPFTLPERIDGKSVTPAEATDVIMRRVASLLPAQYRGVYAE